jgi:transcriptional regulator with PAS, ATPase and Fis domain
MDGLIGRLRRVLDRDIPILIVGETGTGKELLARAIHHDSARAGRPFVVFNGAATLPSQVEAELFGVDGGTLFLDAVDEMPPAVQAHLLRVLQERRVIPVGSARAQESDLAIIGATRHDLRARIASRDFREDLYYRLNGLTVRLPPLRDRQDLPTLARRLLDRDAGSRHLRLSAEVLSLFAAGAWPGNLRQLHNVLRTAAVLAGHDGLITPEHLPDDLAEELRQPRAPAPRSAPAPVPAGSARSLQAMEVAAIERTLEETGGNIAEAAKRLGISRNTIYRKLRWRPRPAA